MRTAVPEVMEIELPTKYHKGRIMVGGEVVQTFGGRQFSTLEGLTETLEKLNAKLASDPIPGRSLKDYC